MRRVSPTKKFLIGTTVGLSALVNSCSPQTSDIVDETLYIEFDILHVLSLGLIPSLRPTPTPTPRPTYTPTPTPRTPTPTPTPDSECFTCVYVDGVDGTCTQQKMYKRPLSFISQITLEGKLDKDILGTSYCFPSKAGSKISWQFRALSGEENGYTMVYVLNIEPESCQGEGVDKSVGIGDHSGETDFFKYEGMTFVDVLSGIDLNGCNALKGPILYSLTLKRE